MTDKQYTLLDELYFIQNVKSLHSELGWTKAEVEEVLLQLFENGWLTVLLHEQFVEISKEELVEQIEQFGFIASKKGLFAHNSN
jgi:hypothetical protein